MRKRLEYFVQRPLTDEELTAILDGINGADTPQVAMLRAFTVFDILLEDVGLTVANLRRANLEIRGDCLKIPQEQWLTISNALIAWSHNDATDLTNLGRVDMGLTWMNWGPSSYEEKGQKS